MEMRLLRRDEVELLWTIDRSEVIERMYVMEQGTLVLRDAPFVAHGWPPGEAEHYTPLLYECFDRGGLFFGCFADGQLVGLSVLDTLWLGPERDQLQLLMMHVSCAYRGRGIGATLFRQAARAARERGAKWLYISATPTEHTVQFYLHLGATLNANPDPVLFAREPEDIHLLCAL